MRNLRSVPALPLGGDAHIIAPSDLPRVSRVRRVPFGIPSVAQSAGEDAPLNLSDVVARQPATTFFVRMASDALFDSGIYTGDVLVVDQTLRPHYGALVVVTLAAMSGALLVRHYCPDSAALHLLPAHPDVLPISVRARDLARCHVWGVVTGIVQPRGNR